MTRMRHTGSAVTTVPDSATERCWITSPDQRTGYAQCVELDAFIESSSVVYYRRIDHDMAAPPHVWRLQGEGVAELARAAACKRTDRDGNELLPGTRTVA